VWDVRVFTGRDEKGRPRQISETVQGGRKELVLAVLRPSELAATQANSSSPQC